MTLTQLHTLANTCQINFNHLIAECHDNDICLGIGGDLTVATLLHAYRCGAFPWFEDEPIAWYSPNPRCVITPSDFHPSKSLTRTARKHTWTLTTNLAFDNVIHACSQPRTYSNNTWINSHMIRAYQTLHDIGVAVSVEVWADTPLDSELIGGLYGVQIGRLFCGESMFHKVTDASKIAFWGLMSLCTQQGITLVDCQLENPHLMSLGAKLINRKEFIKALPTLVNSSCQGFDNPLSLSAQALITPQAPT